MHVVVAVLYGFTLWLSCLAYAAIVCGRWGVVALAMPLFVSGGAAAILTLDLIWTGLSKAIRHAKKIKSPA